MSSGIEKQGRFTVLDRGSTKERLKEIADQQLGLYDEIKTTNASRSLGAEKILIGSVTKFGKILRNHREDFRCSKGKLIYGKKKKLNH